MRALFAKGVAQSSVLRKLDARTKLIVTATTAVLTVASSGMVSQLVLFAVTLVYVLLLKRPRSGRCLIRSDGGDDGHCSALRAGFSALDAGARRAERQDAPDSLFARTFHDERGDGSGSHYTCGRSVADVGTHEVAFCHLFAHGRDAALYSDFCQRHQTGLGNSSHQGLAVGAGDAHATPDSIGPLDSGTDSVSGFEELGNAGRCRGTQRNGCSPAHDSQRRRRPLSD